MLLAAAEALDIDTRLIPRIATPFGGGMGLQSKEVCGAVSGALMALGLARGRDIGDDPAVKERAYELAVRFMQQFETRNGVLRCIDLTGLDLTQPDSFDIFDATGQRERCAEYVNTAVMILEELGILPTNQETP